MTIIIIPTCLFYSHFNTYTPSPSHNSHPPRPASNSLLPTSNSLPNPPPNSPLPPAQAGGDTSSAPKDGEEEGEGEEDHWRAEDDDTSALGGVGGANEASTADPFTANLSALFVSCALLWKRGEWGSGPLLYFSMSLFRLFS